MSEDKRMVANTGYDITLNKGFRPKNRDDAR